MMLQAFAMIGPRVSAAFPMAVKALLTKPVIATNAAVICGWYFAMMFARPRVMAVPRLAWAVLMPLVASLA